MDPAKKPTFPDRSESDADLGLILYKTGRAIKAFFMWIARALGNIGHALSIAIFFLLRNILWLLLGAAVGLGYGMYLANKNGTQYRADMTVKANFNSTRSLYNVVDYVNALIGGGRTADLAAFFNISPKEANQLRGVSATAVKSELITADMYREHFMANDRTVKVRQDTFWVRTVNYKDFKESLTNFDFPYHNISVISTDPTVFSKLEQGILRQISKNELLQEVRSKQTVSNRDEEQLLVAAIRNIDTLRQAYNQRLMSSQPTSVPGSGQVNVIESASEMKTPELELYDKMLELQDELKRSRERSLTENDIIEVLSPFNPVGRQLGFFRQYAGRYTLIGLILSFCILLVLGSYKTLLHFFNPKNHPRRHNPLPTT